MEENQSVRKSSGFFDYFELLRLPNVFTAVGDSAMGFLFVQALETYRDGWMMTLLLAASSFCYLAGIVLNDVFDYDLDLLERPERPLPSGRVPVSVAQWLGWKLLIAGFLCGWGAAYLAHSFLPGLAVSILAALILLYNLRLKATLAGPLVMGACRFMNVLLGMSLAEQWGKEHYLIAGGIGVYIMGLTLFARTEERKSSRVPLILALIVMLLGISMLGMLLQVSDRIILILQLEPRRWYLLIGFLGLMIAWRSAFAISNPLPEKVRSAVAQGIISLLFLDAAVTYAMRDSLAAAALLLLLIPATYLGRWIPST